MYCYFNKCMWKLRVHPHLGVGYPLALHNTNSWTTLLWIWCYLFIIYLMLFLIFHSCDISVYSDDILTAVDTISFSLHFLEWLYYGGWGSTPTWGKDILWHSTIQPFFFRCYWCMVYPMFSHIYVIVILHSSDVIYLVQLLFVEVEGPSLHESRISSGTPQNKQSNTIIFPPMVILHYYFDVFFSDLDVSFNFIFFNL